MSATALALRNTTLAMSYVETEEQQMLRKQVREIGRKYGREY